MLIGRFLMLLPLLAIAGSLAEKKQVPVSAGTFPTHGPLFVGLLVGVVIIVGASDLLPRSVAGSDRRASDALRKDSLWLLNLQEPIVETQPSQPPLTGDSTALGLSRGKRARPLFDPPIVRRAIVDSFVKLNPATLAKNPVMFVVEVGAVLTTVLMVRTLITGGSGFGFELQIAAWLWFTVLFANFAEAMAEGRGKAQADSLRKTKTRRRSQEAVAATAKSKLCPPSALRKGDVCLCEPNDIIPGDGDVIEGIASVDESVITGESAPVIRESGGDRSAVTGGTKVLSDYIKVQITSNPGETFLDRMIALVEGAQRQKTPNEIALNIMIAGLTLIFLLAVVTLAPFAQYSVDAGQSGHRADRHRSGLAAGLPDPDHHRRPALRHRHRRHGPRHAAQRARHERQGRRSRRRRQHAAARQDRHHHARQSPGRGIHSRRRRLRSGSGRCRAAFQPRRRNARRPQHRRAGQREIRPARPRSRRASRPSSFPSPPRPA